METTKATELLQTIRAHNEAYRIGKPIISDAEYDKEVAQLRELDPENDWFKHNEPAPTTKSRKVKLPIPMKSLNKVKSYRELTQWAKSLALPETAMEERTNADKIIRPAYKSVSDVVPYVPLGER